MTKEKILIKALNNRCQYESSKEMDYETHLAIMDAMDEYAEQQVKNCVIPAVINRRELLVAFILWYWFKCKDKETREAGDLIDEFLATNSL